LNARETTKKIFVLLPGLALLAAVVGGAVVFDRNSQDRKMRAIESRLKSIKGGVRSGNDNGTRAILTSTETELTELSDRWIAERKDRARRRIARLNSMIESKASAGPKEPRNLDNQLTEDADK
jgi:hypothetical protein